MVLEFLTNPWKMELRARNMVFFGFLYCTVAIFLSYWIFKAYSSLIMVFLATMATIPLMISTIKLEEQKDLKDLEEKILLKEHWKALSAFMFLFLGFTVAFLLWYIVLPQGTVNVLFESQIDTLNAINSKVTGLAISDSLSVFNRIFLNNMRVLIFCILFSFLYGAGAIFILCWNASVIGAAIGNFIRTKIALISNIVGATRVMQYFQIISFGLLKYSIHGIPEILAYFTAGLAGGIISMAVIRHDFGTRKFEHILLVSADLLLLSLALLFVAALLEVYVTPIIFG